MTLLERKLFRQTALLGAMVTLLVICAKNVGLLEGLEQWIYDRRARLFQTATPPPTDRLIHLDIDDNALETIGTWPWARTEWARVVDELHRAGAKCVGFDVFFSEAQKIEHQPAPGGGFTPVDHDVAFAGAIGRAGNVVLGVPLKIEDDAARVPPEDRGAYLALAEAFKKDLALTEESAGAFLRSRGSDGDAADEYVKRFFVSARKRAVFELIQGEMAKGNLDLTAARKKLIVPLAAQARPIVERVFDPQFDRAYAIHAMTRFGAEMPAGAPPLLKPQYELATIPTLSAVAAASGFVDDYLRFEDGTIRSLPLLVNYRGKLFGQFGFMLALQALDVPLAEVTVTADGITLPATGRLKAPVTIPVYVRDSDRYGAIGAVMDVPWFGPAKWERMYDHRREGMDKQHLSVIAAWRVWDVREKAHSSGRSADTAILTLLGPDGVQPDGRKRKGFLLDEARAGAYAAQKPAVEDLATRAAAARSALQILADSQYIEQYNQTPDLSAEDRLFRDELVSARAALEEYVALTERLRFEEETLRAAVADKAVLIGWIAEGKVDLVPTPLHAAAPGVVVHGAVLNAILTQDFWHRAPGWVSYVVILIVGGLATFVASRLPPWQSMAATLGIILIPGLIDGLLIFDRWNVIVDAAGPAVVAPAVWSILTVVRFIVERAERQRITKRFNSYVDPALVSYVLENPDQLRLAGEERELTVVFTDLGGFTTLTEKLRTGTVPILNEYMSLMVPIIRKHGGYVNKFLGDGIMFFFGAPRPNADHAGAAVDAVMEMQAAMPPFNRSLEARELPTLIMRVGINTGPMVVGDAGPVDGSDYTVLGDAVNLSARLESANKATGTLVMIGERTAELVKDRYVLLPLAKLQVAGKSEGVMTFSPVERKEKATAEQKRKSEMQYRMVELYQAGRWADCRAFIDEFAAEFGDSKITSLYRAYCIECIEETPALFDGTIVLKEK